MMFASKPTLFVCLLALCMAFVSAKPISATTVKTASSKLSLSVAKLTVLPKSSSLSKTIKSSSSKSSSSASKSTVLQIKSKSSAVAKSTPAKISSVVSKLTSLSIKSTSSKATKSSSTKPSSSVLKSTLRSTKSLSSTTVKSTTVKTSAFKPTSHSTKPTQSTKTSSFSVIIHPSAVPQSASVGHPSLSSVSLPSPTLQPFNTTWNRYGQSTGGDSQSLLLHISDPSTLTESTCGYTWAGYSTYPPGYWEHTAPWISCDDKTFSFKITQVTPSGLVAWSYKIKHQYMGNGTECVSPTDSGCITTIGHADIRLIGNAMNNAIGDSYWCGASGTCNSSKYGWVAGPIDSTCKGAACEGMDL